MIVLAFGAAAAVIGASSIATFYLESVVAASVTPALAGTLLAVESVAEIEGRVGWGRVGGRWHKSNFPLLAALLVTGAVGYAWLVTASIAPATIVTFPTGRGRLALFNVAIVIRSVATPAFATGTVATGLYGGGIVGPTVYGFLVHGGDYSLAWSFVALAAPVSTAMFYIGGRMLEARVAYFRS